MSTKKYFNEFDSSESVARDFFDQKYTSEPLKVPEDFPTEEQILLAWYGYGSYCGSAMVLFQRDGKLFEVKGGHCSCYGLEGQWKPGEVTWKALAMRPRADADLSADCYEVDPAAIEAFWALVDAHVPPVAETAKPDAN